MDSKASSDSELDTKINDDKKTITKLKLFISDVTSDIKVKNIVKNFKKGSDDDDEFSEISIEQLSNRLSEKIDFLKKDVLDGDSNDLIKKLKSKDEDQHIHKYGVHSCFSADDSETELSVSVDSPILSEVENDLEENETLDGVSLDAITEVSSFSSKEDYSDKTESNNRESSNPTTWWKFQVSFYHFFMATCLIILPIILIFINQAVHQLNDISSQLQSVTAHIAAGHDSDIKNRLRSLAADIHVVADTMSPAEFFSIIEEIQTTFKHQAPAGNVNMNRFQHSHGRYDVLADGKLHMPAISLLEEHTETVHITMPTPSLMSNQTSCNFNLNKQKRPHLLYCPRFWDCMYYEDVEFATELAISRSQKTVDLGSPLSTHALDFNGSCINENWSMMDDMCDAQATDLQTLSKSLPFSVSNHSTHVNEWFKEFVSQPFEAKHTCAVNYVHLATYAQEERSMNSNVVFLSLLYSHPFQSGALSFLFTSLAFFAISSAILSLLRMLSQICQAVRQILPAYHTKCNNTTEKRRVEHYGACKGLASFPGTPVLVKFKADQSCPLFWNIIIIVVIFLTFFPQQCGIVTNNASRYATCLMPNVTEVAGSSTLAQKSETAAAAYNVSSILSALKANSDHVLALVHAVFRCSDFHKALGGIVTVVIVVIAPYCKGNVTSRFYDLLYRIQSGLIFYHVIRETSLPEPEIESTNKTLIPSLTDEDQHRELNQKKKKHGSRKKRRWLKKFTCYCQRPPRPQRCKFKIRNHTPCLSDGVVNRVKNGNLDHCSPSEQDTITVSPSDDQPSNHCNLDYKFEPQIFEVKTDNPHRVQTCSQVLVPASKIPTSNCKFKCPTSNAEGQIGRLTPYTSMPQSIEAAHHVEINFEASMAVFESTTHPLPATSEVHRTNHRPIGDLPTVLARSKNWHNDCETITCTSRLLAISIHFSNQWGEFFQECCRMQNELVAPVKCDCFVFQFLLPSPFQLEAGTMCLCESSMFSWLSAITNIDKLPLSEDFIHILRAFINTAGSIQCQMKPTSIHGIASSNPIDPTLKPLDPADVKNRRQNSSVIHLIISRGDVGKMNLEQTNIPNNIISPELSLFESASNSIGTVKPPPAAAESNAGQYEGEYENFSIKRKPPNSWCRFPPNSLAMHQQALQCLSTGDAASLQQERLHGHITPALVILSSCDSGCGMVKADDILFGMARAFIQAGAKSVLTTLWKVPSESGSILMLSSIEGIFSGPPPLIPSQGLQIHVLHLSTPTPGVCVAVGHLNEAILSPPTLLYHNVTNGVYPNCRLPSEILFNSSTPTTIVSQFPTVLHSPASEKILLACNLPMIKFHTLSPKEQIPVNVIAVEPRVHDNCMVIKFHTLSEHEQIAESIQISSIPAHHPDLALQLPNCVSLTSLPEREQLVSDPTCIVDPQLYDGSSLFETADGNTSSIAVRQCPTLQLVNCTLLSPIPNKELVAIIELRSYKGSRIVSLCGSECKEEADGIAIAMKASIHPDPDLTFQCVHQIPRSRERAEVMQERYCRSQKENLKLHIEHLTPSNKRKTTRSHNTRYFNTNGDDKNGQSAVKKKNRSLSYSSSGTSAATTMTSGTGIPVCSQLHANDATPCCVPALQNPYNSVKDFSESANTISIHSNRNDTSLLNRTNKFKATKRRYGNTSDGGRCDTKIKTKRSGGAGGTGYLGDKDSESSGDVRLHSTHRKIKKKKQSPTKRQLSSTAPPISLFRGKNDKPLKETNPYPPASACIVAGSSTHLRSWPCPVNVAYPCRVQARQLLINPRSILQLLLQHCRSQIRRAHHHPEHGTSSEDDSPASASAHISIEENSHQQHPSAVVHGSVLLRPPSQELQDTVSLPFSNQVIEGILSMLPSYTTHLGSSMQPSCACDSGLGTSSSGRRRRMLVQDDPHPPGTALAVNPIPPRILHSTEPNWSSAEEIVERDNDPGNQSVANQANDEATTDQRDEENHEIFESAQEEGMHSDYGSEYETTQACTEEDTHWPSRAQLVTLCNTAIPHRILQRRAQSQAVVVLQNDGSQSSSGYCLSPLSQALMHIASSVPIPHSGINGFVALSEAHLESSTNFDPSCIVIGHRPIPAVSCPPCSNIHHPPLPPAPVPVVAILPHSHSYSSPGLMMFAASMEPQSGASLVGIPGSVANDPPPPQPQPMNHHHNPVIFNSSQHQPGNGEAFHAIVEDAPPEELIGTP